MTPWWLVEIDNRWAWVERYRTPANAVFGALRKLETERLLDPDQPHDIRVEKLPPKPRAQAAAAYTRELRQRFNSLR